MANLMSILLNVFTKLKLRQFSEKQISGKIKRNLTVGPIEFIEAAIEMLKHSLSLENINKKKIFRKIFTENEGVTLN
jgi:hypothetical protein